MSVRIRHIDESEREAELRLRHYGFGAYPPARLEDADLARMEPAEVLGAFEDATLLASIHLYDFRQMLRGVPRTMGGIAGVASYPEARRRGLVRDLMHAAIAEMHQRGTACSMLHPFRVSFYERFGYAAGDDTLFADYPPSAFARWVDDPDAGSLRMSRYHALDAWDAYAELADRALNGAAAGGAGPRGAGAHGPVLFSSIGEAHWRRKVDDQACVLFAAPETPNTSTEAGLIFRKVGAEPDAEMRVYSWRAATRRGMRAVLRFFALHVDQCRSVVLPVGPMSSTGRIFRHTGDIEGSVRIEPMRRPWMVRLIDIPSAIDALPDPAGEAGACVVGVTDPQCEGNTGSYRIASDGQQLRCERAAGGERPAREADMQSGVELNLSIAGLSALVYGTQPPEEIFAGAAGEAWAKAGSQAPAPARGATARPPRADTWSQAQALLACWFPERPLWNDWMF
jgi:predicted acetyltransferase